MKKALCFMGGILTVAALSGSAVFSVPVLAQTVDQQASVLNQSDDQTQQSPIDRVAIEWEFENERSLRCGEAYFFTVNVYRKDGTKVPGRDSDSDVICELTKKMEQKCMQYMLLRIH